MNACDQHISEQFLAGCLSADDESQFIEHLDHCDSCRRLLEESAGGDQAVATARSCLMFADATDAFPCNALGDSHVLSEMPGPSMKKSAIITTALSLLSPSDDPASLGRIGQYEVRSVIGRGGFGIVFKAYDRALSRNVAIKSLDPAYATVAAARQRFAREAKAMAAVSHEHVVPVYGVDEHQGIPYFVMEYVAGGTLEGRLRRCGTLDPTSIVTIAMQTAQALAAAHRHGLVHRDIKPGNILLDEGTDRVRVTDFGLARVANDVNCTRSGFVVGTPQYMSPEQVRGEACDGRGDLFSLGSVMYEMATGHSPFRGDGVYAVMQRIVNDTPRPIREQNPAIPRWLEGLVERLLSKSAAQRFSSSEELVETLLLELAHLKSPMMAAQPPRLWLKRKPIFASTKARFAVTGGAFALSAIATSFVLSLGMQQAADPEQNAKNPEPPSTASMVLDDVPEVKLWDHDGTRQLQKQVAELEQRWMDSDATASNDAWSRTMVETRVQMEYLRREELSEPPQRVIQKTETIHSSGRPANE
jgi:serine/threonine protein kinase